MEEDPQKSVPSSVKTTTDAFKVSTHCYECGFHIPNILLCGNRYILYLFICIMPCQTKQSYLRPYWM